MIFQGKILQPSPVRCPGLTRGASPPLSLAGVPLPLPVTPQELEDTALGDEQAEVPHLSPLPMEQENDPPGLPPHAQVTPVPESVRSWLSQNNFCLVKANSLQRDFAGFTEAAAPCFIVGECPNHSDEPLEPSASESESDSAAARDCKRDPGIARIIRTTASCLHRGCSPRWWLRWQSGCMPGKHL